MDMLREVVVQVWKGNSVFSSDWLPYDDFVDVVELIPVLIKSVLITDKRLKFRPTRNGNVQGFGCEKRLQVKQVEIIVVDQISQQLVSKTIQC